jgi:glycosidase
MSPEERIKKHLTFIFGEEEGKRAFKGVQRIVEKYADLLNNEGVSKSSINTTLSESEAILITYGDQVHEKGRPPLQSLNQFLENYLEGKISAVHILPFFPYSSDDGFSVIDYRRIDPELGSWMDINRIGKNFSLMFDAVINHISRESEWFQAFLRGESPYTNYFITVDPGANLSEVVRPRARPLLTEVSTASGKKQVWTTFSDDQIDLNYANPDVLLEILELILFYAWKGAKFIRLDAIAYLWKEIGTSCIHLPKTHAIVKLMRALLDMIAPQVLLITETNVPHEENISYFGTFNPETGLTDEAQLVYQFPLAPLVLDAFLKGNAHTLSRWADSLEPGAIFFNFIASHDGIGVMPARGLLSEEEIQALVKRTLEHGGEVSYKSNPDGSRSVYELNITLYDALNDPASPSQDIDATRFLASQAIMLSLAGVPGIYFHSLIGARNCRKCVAETGRARSINREKFDYKSLKAELERGESQQARIFSTYRRWLEVRRDYQAFHPKGSQKVLLDDPQVFLLLRISPDEEQSILCMINVSSAEHNCPLSSLPKEFEVQNEWQDILTKEIFRFKGELLEIPLGAYQARWLTPLGGIGQTPKVFPENPIQ